MIKLIKLSEIEKSIKISNNQYLVMVDGFNSIFNDNILEQVRNIFLVDQSGQVIWRIYSNADEERSGSFTNIYYEDNKLKAYRWNGGQYDIDIKTGLATPDILLK